MPLPPGLVVKNGTNRLSAFAMPGPVSRISMHRRPRVRDTATSTPRAHSVRRLDRVLQQIDQRLLELTRIRRRLRSRTARSTVTPANAVERHEPREAAHSAR